METCLFDIRDKFAFPYLGDIMAYSEDFRSHLDHLWIVFRPLKERDIKINSAKCKFFQKAVNFLRRVISGDGYKIDSKNINAVKYLAATPSKTIHDLWHLLGLLGYYQRYGKNFSKVTYSLFKLLKKEQLNNKPIKPTTPITWKEEHEQSLQRIIDKLTNPPTVSYSDFLSLFMLHVDASSKGLGCAFYQRVDEEIEILGYGTGTLNKTEQKYHSSKLEFLGLKWTVTEHFRDYLLYAAVVYVYTDNNYIVYVLSSAKLNATGQRWVNQLADFNLTLH